MYDDFLFTVVFTKLSNAYPNEFISLGKSYRQYSSGNLELEIHLRIGEGLTKYFKSMDEFVDHFESLFPTEVIKIDLTGQTKMFRG